MLEEHCFVHHEFVGPDVILWGGGGGSVRRNFLL